MEIKAEGRYGQGRDLENIYLRSKMKLMNLVPSFALASIMGFTGPIHAILRALKRQLRRSRLRFSKKSRQLWSGSCWTGAVDRPPPDEMSSYDTRDGRRNFHHTVFYELFQSASWSNAILRLQFTVSPPCPSHSLLFMALSILHPDATNQILASATFHNDIGL
jgi:hypothetical protein